MFLLDTDVVSELRRHDQTDARVAAWADTLHPSAFFLSAITILEIEAGIVALEQQDEKQGAALRSWVDNNVLPAFEGRILPVDIAVAQRSARLQLHHPRRDRDALIAATALVHRLTVVTRHPDGFQPLGVDLLNPWS